MTRWIPALPLSDLPVGSQKLVKLEGERFAVFHVDGEVFATDDQCPHEGYPLSQGSVCGTTLTCCFHNFKFDLRDGQCTLGDEAVRTLPTRVVDGVVELDLTPPDPTAYRERTWASLRTAMGKRRIGQVSRDAVRLLNSGVPAAELLAFVAEFDAAHGEYGTTHALPVAADLVRWLDRYDGVQAAFPVVQGLEIASEFHVRMPVRPVVEPVDPGDPVTFSDRLQALCEAEDADGAEALLRGALDAGWSAEAVVWPVLLRLAADHFLDYGHGLIYVVKLAELLDAVGWERAPALFPALLHAIVTGTREDVLPAWSGWRKRQGTRDGAWADWAAGTDALDDPDGLVERLLAGGAQAEVAVEGLLRGGTGLRGLAEALCVAAAIRVLRFDTALEFDPTWRDNWLSVSHVQTFANAVRRVVERSPGPDAVRLLFQGIRFVGMTQVLDGPGDWEAEPLLVEARAALEADPEAVRERWMDAVIEDAGARAIVVSHGIKQVVAGFDDFAATGRPECALAAIRFAAGAKQERRVARLTREAVALVTEGAIPRRKVP